MFIERIRITANMQFLIEENIGLRDFLSQQIKTADSPLDNTELSRDSLYFYLVAIELDPDAVENFYLRFVLFGYDEKVDCGLIPIYPV